MADNPGSYQSAPTPAAHAPTPGFAAATPAPVTPWGMAYETPGGVFGTQYGESSAPTPGAPGGSYLQHQAATFSKHFSLSLHVQLFNSQKLAISQTWLVEPELQGQKFLVTVIGTRLSSPPYRDGEYEGRQGYVDSVFNPQADFSTAHSQTAEVIFDNPPEKITFPIQYLAPVKPDRMKDRVVALGGEHKGTQLTVQQIDSEECAVSKLQNGGVVFDINVEMLGKIHQ